MVVNVAPPKAIVEDELEILDEESMEADADEEANAEEISAEEGLNNDGSSEETKSDN